MNETVEITDHGKTILVPLTSLVVMFTCPSCHRDQPLYLFPSKPVQEGFGTCPACGVKLLGVNASLDFGTITDILKERGEVVIFWE